jgi:hypothetical protein
MKVTEDTFSVLCLPESSFENEEISDTDVCSSVEPGPEKENSAAVPMDFVQANRTDLTKQRQELQTVEERIDETGLCKNKT